MYKDYIYRSRRFIFIDSFIQCLNIISSPRTDAKVYFRGTWIRSSFWGADSNIVIVCHLAIFKWQSRLILALSVCLFQCDNKNLIDRLVVEVSSKCNLENNAVVINMWIIKKCLCFLYQQFWICLNLLQLNRGPEILSCIVFLRRRDEFTRGRAGARFFKWIFECDGRTLFNLKLEFPSVEMVWYDVRQDYQREVKWIVQLAFAMGQ